MIGDPAGWSMSEVNKTTTNSFHAADLFSLCLSYESLMGQQTVGSSSASSPSPRHFPQNLISHLENITKKRKKRILLILFLFISVLIIVVHKKCRNNRWSNVWVFNYFLLFISLVAQKPPKLPNLNVQAT